MKSSIIKIGNSSGLILPQSILKQLNLTTRSVVSIQLEGESIVIKPGPRQGWAEAAKAYKESDQSEADNDITGFLDLLD